MGFLPDRAPTVRHFVYIKWDTPDLLPASPDNGDDFYRVIGVKFWYDGSPYTGSMYLRDPYLDSPLAVKGLNIPSGSVRKPVIQKRKFHDLAEKYQRHGWQLAVHAQGDQAVAEVLDVFVDLNNKASIAPYRDRIEHGVLYPPALLEKSKALGITPSFHINHLFTITARRSKTRSSVRKEPRRCSLPDRPGPPACV